VKFGRTLTIAATATAIPDQTISTEQAVAEGLTDAEDSAKVGMLGLPVSPGLPGPHWAVHAGTRALIAAGWTAEDLDLVVHAWIHHQGHDFWSPAHYVAAQLGASRAVPLGLQQMCNGAAAGLEIVASRLLADPIPAKALVTTGDRFAEEGFDRWRGDYGVWYGDGGTACLLERRDRGEETGLLLRSMASRAVAEAEALHRGVDPFTPAPRWTSPVIDVRRTKKAFIETHGLDGFYARSHEALRGVVQDALADADLELDDPSVTLLAIPRVGQAVIAETYRPALEGLTKASVTSWGEHTGHLGAGDIIANLDRAVSSGSLRPGHVGLFVSAGGGFTFSCAVVEVAR
jgi:3-oxoacyl-[acyl-carrier-protein] synthase III